jgi:hypothetical protein
MNPMLEACIFPPSLFAVAVAVPDEEELELGGAPRVPP